MRKSTNSSSPATTAEQAARKAAATPMPATWRTVPVTGSTTLTVEYWPAAFCWVPTTTIALPHEVTATYSYRLG